MNRFAIFILLSICSSALAAELKNSVSGQLIDASTNQPIYYANIFLANTTIGTTSNQEGHFTLKNIPTGNYSLVVSFMGYELEMRAIQVAAGARTILNFALKPTVLEMEALQVVDTLDRTWRVLFDTFKKDFFGFTENAYACEFINPEVMHLDTDEDGVLSGRTLKPLEMLHKNFGYKVFIIVSAFQASDDEIAYFILPQYSELAPIDEAQASAWKENRKKAFYGSYRHFFYALFLGQLEDAGFSAELVNEPKRFRTPTVSFSSSTAFGHLYSNTEFPLLKRLHFPEFLRIRHLENWAQTSFLKMPFDTMQVDISGNSLSDAKIRRSGHWSQIRFADELPLDWMPN